jgi:hypothetical protein
MLLDLLTCGPRHRPAVRRRAGGAGALASCRAWKRLIELTGAKVVFEPAVRDEVVAGERRRGGGGRNSGRAQSKSMIHGKSFLWKMRQARRIATWLTTLYPKASHNLRGVVTLAMRQANFHIRRKRFSPC